MKYIFAFQFFLFFFFHSNHAHKGAFKSWTHIKSTLLSCNAHSGITSTEVKSGKLFSNQKRRKNTIIFDAKSIPSAVFDSYWIAQMRFLIWSFHHFGHPKSYLLRLIEKCIVEFLEMWRICDWIIFIKGNDIDQIFAYVTLWMRLKKFIYKIIVSPMDFYCCSKYSTLTMPSIFSWNVAVFGNFLYFCNISHIFLNCSRGIFIRSPQCSASVEFFGWKTFDGHSENHDDASKVWINYYLIFLKFTTKTNTNTYANAFMMMIILTAIKDTTSTIWINIFPDISVSIVMYKWTIFPVRKNRTSHLYFPPQQK